ncbi:hypothetical protein A1O3_08257 [Capronia epimyces CBS 606.96]|uniref:Uncharacterized protein n=1 Tax=Capronia epimyces CBS 606.96 TaxID=1182542 RepID=W9XSM5_9EURO|nr:uncharacterized protein A1O3_08257 [Capronia epimyces CBS 606.96]EXJ79971.1 hypothetical protein A1O3_08257 [Capronia epimyces CBS 606.96]
MDRLTAAMKSPTKAGSMAPDTSVRPKSCASPRPSTPQNRLLGRGSLGSLRRLRSRLSLGSLRKSSPERKDVTRLSGHVTGGSPVHSRPSFRPLSIVNTALHPFNFDVTAAMHAVQDQTLSPSHKANSTAECAPGDSMASGQESSEPLAQFARLSNEERDDDEKTIKPAGRSDEDLPAQAFPPSPSPSPAPAPANDAQERANNPVFTGNFRSLINLPAPDISQHPAFQSDPATSTSDAPLLVTTSTAAEIRQWAKERGQVHAEHGNGVNAAAGTPNSGAGGANPANDQASGAAGAMTPRRAVRFVTPTGPRRREGRRSSEARTPGVFSLRHNFSRLRLDSDNAETETSDALTGGAAMTSPTAQPKTPVDSDKRAKASGSQEVEPKRTGLRKVTGLFKSKSDKTQPDPTSPLPDRPNYRRPREDLVRSFST